MGKLPFIPMLDADADAEPKPSAEIVEFPREVSANRRLREARRQLQRCKDSIDTDDLYSSDMRTRTRAAASIAMLDVWVDDVAKAEAEIAMLNADDTLTFRGQMYRAHRSTNGAN
jgi:hypothetical protein